MPSVHDDEDTPSSNRPPDRASFLPPGWAQLQPLLDKLLDTPTEQRASRLAELSPGNPTLRRQLAQLLAEAERNTPLLDESVAKRFNDLANDNAAPALPEVLAGRYRVSRELGRGGMAFVYLARDEKHGRDVAIKVIRQDLSASLGHDRFLREIEIAARLRHPNIVPLYDSGEVDGSLFFVMPYEEGQSLRERLRQTGALPVADALGVLRDVARALAYAHEHGVVHRDVKPDNVMLSGGAAVVTDFGIAKAVTAALTTSPDATLTQAGTVIGTPAYMAPEQATGDAAVDHRADIYSFGCLGYELFAGHPPFQGDSTHVLIAAHIATPPRPVVELRPDIPGPVAELLARCLAKAPADRPQSARELLPILDGVSSVAGATSSPNRTLEPRRSNRARTWTAIGALAAVAAVGTYFATHTHAATAPITLAVLPFANIARDSTIDFLADGLADEVASTLARVPGILIKSRSGARAYRGQLAPDVTAAGARLKADYLLTAVVRLDRGRWVLSADVARAADASSVWSENFVVSPDQQAAVVDSIAASLTTSLHQRFPRAIGVAPVRLRTQRTPNNEAYRLYLRGQERLARRGRSVKESVDLFRQAIKEDSLFAPGYSGLSMALALLPWIHVVPLTVVYDDIVAAARRALDLDSTLSLPHVALGMAHWETYDWAHAATEFETAVRLDPNNVEARVQYARFLRSVGRHAEALVQLRAARSLDPASAIVLSHMAGDYLRTGQLDSAVAEMRRALQMDTASVAALVIGPDVYLESGRLAEAHALAVRSGNSYVLAKSGDVEGARQALRRLEERPDAWGIESERAFAYVGLGDTASALSALERATDAREFWPLHYDIADPRYDAVRGSARFRKLVERVGLASYYPIARPR